MGLISSRFMTAEQRERCCFGLGLSEALGHNLYTIDGRRIGRVDDILMDDESFTIRYLVTDTSTADFVVNQPYVLLTADLCCWDEESKSVRSQATVEQVQSAPAYERAVDLVLAYEQTAILNFGERPYAPADH